MFYYLIYNSSLTEYIENEKKLMTTILYGTILYILLHAYFSSSESKFVLKLKNYYWLILVLDLTFIYSTYYNDKKLQDWIYNVDSLKNKVQNFILNNKNISNNNNNIENTNDSSHIEREKNANNIESVNNTKHDNPNTTSNFETNITDQLNTDSNTQSNIQNEPNIQNEQSYDLTNIENLEISDDTKNNTKHTITHDANIINKPNFQQEIELKNSKNFKNQNTSIKDILSEQSGDLQILDRGSQSTPLNELKKNNLPPQSENTKYSSEKANTLSDFNKLLESRQKDIVIDNNSRNNSSSDSGSEYDVDLSDFNKLL